MADNVDYRLERMKEHPRFIKLETRKITSDFNEIKCLPLSCRIMSKPLSRGELAVGTQLGQHLEDRGNFVNQWSAQLAY